MKHSIWVNCIYFDCVLSYHFYSLLGSLSVIFNYIRAAKLYFTTSSLLAQSPLTYFMRLHMYLVVAISSVAFPGRFVSSLADCTRSIFILLSGTIFTLLGLFWPSVIVSLWTLLGKFYSFSGPVFTGPFCHEKIGIILTILRWPLIVVKSHAQVIKMFVFQILHNIYE